jgi:hypothetical protein
MSMLARIQRGVVARPPRLVLYGTPGIGKSTFGAQTPKPIFLPTEDGLDQIDCERFPLATKYEDVSAALNELRTDQHEYETVVLDSGDWLERLIFDRVCADFGVKNIEKADGGYARGYIHALNYWREVIDLLNALRDQRGMVVLIIAHTKIEKFEDPEVPPFDRYSPRLNKHAASLITEWADAVLFATRKLRTQTDDAGFGRKRTIAHAVGKDGGERIIRTVGGPTCLAKNRYSLTEELPLSWAAFVAALSNHNPNPGEQSNG